MKRFACVAAVCLVAILGPGVSAARAQTVPEQKMYGEFNFGPTLGHKSSGFLGGDFGYRLTPGLDVVAEISHMCNVGTSNLDDRATIIANALGGTASSAYKVTEFSAGVRYRIPLASQFQPYVLAEFGVANVKTEVAFTVNGTVIDPGRTACNWAPTFRGRSTNRFLLWASASTGRSRGATSPISVIASARFSPVTRSRPTRAFRRSGSSSASASASSSSWRSLPPGHHVPSRRNRGDRFHRRRTCAGRTESPRAATDARLA